LKVIGNFLGQDIGNGYPPLWEWENRGDFETQSSQRTRREGERKERGNEEAKRGSGAEGDREERAGKRGRGRGKAGSS